MDKTSWTYSKVKKSEVKGKVIHKIAKHNRITFTEGKAPIILIVAYLQSLIYHF